MKRWVFFVFALIAVFLETAFLNYFKVFNVKPNLVLSLVVLGSLYLDLRLSLALAIFSGILKDVFVIGSVGINTLLFPLWSFAAIKLSREISLDNNYLRLGLVFIIVFLHDIAASLILFSLEVKAVVALGMFLRITILESLYTAAVFPLVSRIIRPLLPK